MNLNSKLRKETSANSSGKLKHIGRIQNLKEDNYYVLDYDLDGDAPKQFIKVYFYEEGGKVYKSKLKTWIPFIAKTAEKWYPNESVIEFLINRIGEVLGLRMNEIKLIKVNSQIRFMSRYFRSKNEIMVHGAEICGEYLEDAAFAKEIAINKTTARELFSFEFITDAIKNVFPIHHSAILDNLVKLIVFDAIVGNNDRHFYNWAVMRSTKRNGSAPYFSPIYDSARGLLWNWSDKDLVKHYNNFFKGGKKVEKYIKSACPRISIEGNPRINHFSLVKHIWANYPQYNETISKLVSLSNKTRVLEMYQKEFSQFFIKERNFLVDYILKKRFDTLRNLIFSHDSTNN